MGSGSQEEIVIIPEPVPYGNWEGLQPQQDDSKLDRLPKTGYADGGLGSAFLFAGNLLAVLYLLIVRKGKNKETE